MDDIEHLIDTNNFQRINLHEAEKAELMQRTDSKFIVPTALSKEILGNIGSHYFIVENNGQVIPEYISDYFDTSDLSMYLAHQNKRSKRYKVRVRNYSATGDSFLEIKIRVPPGKTIKKRISTTSNELEQASTTEFIASKSPYLPNSLSKILQTRFNRLTLVAKDFQERVTLDFNLHLTATAPEHSIQLDDICVVEVKRSKVKLDSKISGLLKSLGIRKVGFSKYSIGCALLYTSVKQNNFKRILLYLKKIRNEYAEPNSAS
ncbi:MAG: polyphosphate polymerase domain-containing protein [Bacteroidales bacterium]